MIGSYIGRQFDDLEIITNSVKRDENRKAEESYRSDIVVSIGSVIYEMRCLLSVFHMALPPQRTPYLTLLLFYYASLKSGAIYNSKFLLPSIAMVFCSMFVVRMSYVTSRKYAPLSGRANKLCQAIPLFLPVYSCPLLSSKLLNRPEDFGSIDLQRLVCSVYRLQLCTRHSAADYITVQSAQQADSLARNSPQDPSERWLSDVA